MYKTYFFAVYLESASEYYKLLEIHKLDSKFNIKAVSLIYRIKHRPNPAPSFLHSLIVPVTEIHTYKTRYARNLHRSASRTNCGLTRSER